MLAVLGGPLGNPEGTALPPVRIFKDMIGTSGTGGTGRVDVGLIPTAQANTQGDRNVQDATRS